MYNSKKSKLLPPEKLTYENACQYCYRSLAIKEQSERKIREKLQERGFSSEIIFRTIEHLKWYQYLDDNRLARRVITRNLEAGTGSYLRSSMKLRQLGVDHEVIKEVSEDIQANGEIDSISSLREKLSRKFQNFQSFSYGSKEYNRVVRYCLSRGYSFSEIKDVLISFTEE